jgi:hypothetical protein
MYMMCVEVYAKFSKPPSFQKGDKMNVFVAWDGLRTFCWKAAMTTSSHKIVMRFLRFQVTRKVENFSIFTFLRYGKYWFHILKSKKLKISCNHEIREHTLCILVKIWFWSIENHYVMYRNFGTLAGLRIHKTHKRRWAS